MNIIEIKSVEASGADIFSSLTEAQLRQSREAETGLFIAESPKVIRVAMDAGYEPFALLCERKHITGDAADIIARCGDIPIYTGERNVLASLTGYTLTRGVLCAMKRREMPKVEEICRDAHRVVVIDGVVDTTNIGATGYDVGGITRDMLPFAQEGKWFVTRIHSHPNHLRTLGNE